MILDDEPCKEVQREAIDGRENRGEEASDSKNCSEEIGSEEITGDEIGGQEIIDQ